MKMTLSFLRMSDKLVIGQYLLLSPVNTAVNQHGPYFLVVQIRFRRKESQSVEEDPCDQFRSVLLSEILGIINL